MPHEEPTHLREESARTPPGTFRAAVAAIRRYRRYWGSDLVLAALFIAGSVLMSLGNVDLHIAGLFYHGAGKATGWPIGDRMPWTLLYDVPGFAVIGVIATGCLYLLLSHLNVLRGRYRLHVLFLFIALWIGPGIIVESILKGNFGRPRPCELLQFGGFREYYSALTPWLPGMGKSFVSGHSAATYYLSAFYFLFRRSGRYRAPAVLVAVLLLGTLVGIARIAGGGHFASDVAWSNAVVFLVNLVVYYFILNVPAHEDGVTRPSFLPTRHRLFLPAVVVALLVVHSIASITAPEHQHLRHESVYLSGHSGRGTLYLSAPGASANLLFVDSGPVRIAGDALGYGWFVPKYVNRLTTSEDDSGRQVEFSCQPHGKFFSQDVRFTATIPRDSVDRLVLDLQDGEATVDPASIVPEGLSLHNQNGLLVLPRDWEKSPLTITGHGIVR